MQQNSVRTSPTNTGSQPSGFLRRLADWTLKPVAFTAGLLARIWQSRAGTHRPDAKPPKLTRREEKRRRKELVRAAKTAKTPGRRRAA